MRNAEVRAKLEELMNAVDELQEEIGEQRTDDHNENARRMVMAVNVEKRLGALEEKMCCMTAEIKGMVAAMGKQIDNLREELTETDDTYLADLKAVIAERLAGNEETPLSTVELAELAEAAKKVAEAEEMTERRKAQGRRGAGFVF